jgi:ribosome biogenesis protein BMS1
MWVPVEVKRFHNPVLSLLERDGPQNWQGMRSTAQIRKEEQIAIPVNKDSLYKPVERAPRQFKKATIPKKLQEALPFASKPKLAKKTNPASYVARRAVILDPEDRKKRALVQMLSTVSKNKEAKRLETKTQKSQEKAKKNAKEAEKFAESAREEKKRKHRDAGKDRAFKEKKMKRQEH